MELSKLERESTTSTVYAGGRSFSAIWALDIRGIQKTILLYLGSRINFTKNFINSFQSVSLSEVVLQTGYSISAVKSALKVLQMKGYIQKTTPNISLCITNHMSCSFCLTKKIFDEYESKLLEWKKLTHNDTKQRRGFYSFLHSGCLVENNDEPRALKNLGHQQARSSENLGREQPMAPENQALRRQKTKPLGARKPRARAPEDNMFLIDPNYSLLNVCVENEEHTHIKNEESSEVYEETPIELTDGVFSEEVFKGCATPSSDNMAKSTTQISSKNQEIENSANNLPVSEFNKSDAHSCHQDTNLSNLGQIFASERPKNFEKDLSAIAKKLRDTACLVFQRNIFIPFGDCEKAILAAMNKTSATLEDVTLAVEEKAKYHFFSGQSIVAMTSDLVEWIQSKEKIIAGFEKRHLKNEEVQEFSVEKNENYVSVKKVESNPDAITSQISKKSPDSFKLWYESLNKINKNLIKIDLKKYGEDIFLNKIIFTYEGYKKFCHEQLLVCSEN